MTTHTLANQDAILKDYYVEDRVKELSFAENVLYALINKEHGVQAGSRQYVQPIEYEAAAGASADFGEAMTNNTAALYEAFILQRKAQYQRVLVDVELLLATKNKRDAFVRAMDQFDRGFRNFGAKIGRRLYRTQGGSVGKLSIASTTTTTLSFADAAQIFNVQIGMKLQFSATDGTGSLLDGGDFVTVTEVDHEGGTCTIDQDLATAISGVATTSYAFQKGDYNACLNGLEDWLPVDNRAAKLAATFNSVPRNVSSTLMGGVYYDGRAAALDEVLIKLVGKIGKYGGATSHILANPETISNMQLTTSGKIQVQAIESQMRSADGQVLVGFNGYKAVIGSRTVRVYGDRHCPSNRIYALDLSTWTLWYAGELVNWLGEEINGQKLTMAQNEPSAEARLGNFCNLGCSVPGFNGVAEIRAQV